MLCPALLMAWLATMPQFLFMPKATVDLLRVGPHHCRASRLLALGGMQHAQPRPCSAWSMPCPGPWLRAGAAWQETQKFSEHPAGGGGRKIACTSITACTHASTHVHTAYMHSLHTACTHASTHVHTAYMHSLHTACMHAGTHVHTAYMHSLHTACTHASTHVHTAYMHSLHTACMHAGTHVHTAYMHSLHTACITACTQLAHSLHACKYACAHSLYTQLAHSLHHSSHAACTQLAHSLHACKHACAHSLYTQLARMQARMCTQLIYTACTQLASQLAHSLHTACTHASMHVHTAYMHSSHTACTELMCTWLAQGWLPACPASSTKLSDMLSPLAAACTCSALSAAFLLPLCVRCCTGTCCCTLEVRKGGATPTPSFALPISLLLK
jgi:hypothetical protein